MSASAATYNAASGHETLARIRAERASHRVSPTPNAAEAKLASLSLASESDERAEDEESDASRNRLRQPGERRVVQREGHRKHSKTGDAGQTCRDDRRRAGRRAMEEKSDRRRECEPGAAAEQPGLSQAQGRERAVVEYGHARNNRRRWLRLTGWRQNVAGGRDRASKQARTSTSPRAKVRPERRARSGLISFVSFARLGLASADFGGNDWT